MALDLILRNARLASAGPEQPTVDIGVCNGLIVAVEPHLAAEGPAYDAGGRLVSPGLIESHFHLDKARLMDRVPFQPNTDGPRSYGADRGDEADLHAGREVRAGASDHRVVSPPRGDPYADRG